MANGWLYGRRQLPGQTAPLIQPAEPPDWGPPSERDLTRNNRERVRTWLVKEGKASGPEDIDHFLSEMRRTGRVPTDLPDAPDTPAWRRALDQLAAPAEGAYGLLASGADLIGAERAADALLDRAQWVRERTTPEHQAGALEVAEAEGFGGKLGAYITNPLQISHAILASTPSFAAGGPVGRAAGAALRFAGRPVAAAAQGALGQAGVGGISEAGALRGEGAPMGTALIAGGVSGAVTGAVGYGGARVAQRFGIGDVDTMLARRARGETVRGTVSQWAAAPLEAGEELVQSAAEPVPGMVARGEEITAAKIGAAAAEGMVVGAGMGAASRGLVRREARPDTYAGPTGPRYVPAPVVTTNVPSNRDILARTRERQDVHKAVANEATELTPAVNLAVYGVRRGQDMIRAQENLGEQRWSRLRRTEEAIGKLDVTEADKVDLINQALTREVVADRVMQRLAGQNDDVGQQKLRSLTPQDLDDAWHAADSFAKDVRDPETGDFRKDLQGLREENPYYQEDFLYSLVRGDVGQPKLKAESIRKGLNPVLAVDHDAPETVDYFAQQEAIEVVGEAQAETHSWFNHLLNENRAENITNDPVVNLQNELARRVAANARVIADSDGSDWIEGATTALAMQKVMDTMDPERIRVGVQRGNLAEVVEHAARQAPGLLQEADNELRALSKLPSLEEAERLRTRHLTPLQRANPFTSEGMRNSVAQVFQKGRPIRQELRRLERAGADVSAGQEGLAYYDIPRVMADRWDGLFGQTFADAEAGDDGLNYNQWNGVFNNGQFAPNLNDRAAETADRLRNTVRQVGREAQEAGLFDASLDVEDVAAVLEAAQGWVRTERLDNTNDMTSLVTGLQERAARNRADLALKDVLSRFEDTEEVGSNMELVGGENVRRRDVFSYVVDGQEHHLKTAPMYAALQQRTTPAMEGEVAELIRAGATWARHGVLTLNPRWQIKSIFRDAHRTYVNSEDFSPIRGMAHAMSDLFRDWGDAKAAMIANKDLRRALAGETLDARTREKYERVLHMRQLGLLPDARSQMIQDLRAFADADLNPDKFLADPKKLRRTLRLLNPVALGEFSMGAVEARTRSRQLDRFKKKHGRDPNQREVAAMLETEGAPPAGESFNPVRGIGMQLGQFFRAIVGGNLADWDAHVDPKHRASRAAKFALTVMGPQMLTHMLAAGVGGMDEWDEDDGAVKQAFGQWARGAANLPSWRKAAGLNVPIPGWLVPPRINPQTGQPEYYMLTIPTNPTYAPLLAGMSAGAAELAGEGGTVGGAAQQAVRGAVAGAIPTAGIAVGLAADTYDYLTGGNPPSGMHDRPLFTPRQEMTLSPLEKDTVFLAKHVAGEMGFRSLGNTVLLAVGPEDVAQERQKALAEGGFIETIAHMDKLGVVDMAVYTGMGGRAEVAGAAGRRADVEQARADRPMRDDMNRTVTAWVEANDYNPQSIGTMVQGWVAAQPDREAAQALAQTMARDAMSRYPEGSLFRNLLYVDTKEGGDAIIRTYGKQAAPRVRQWLGEMRVAGALGEDRYREWEQTALALEYGR